MSEHKMPAHGQFCWNELATRDLDAAKRFYTELLGWQLKESDAAGMAYNEIVAGGEHVGGLYQMGPEQPEGPSRWTAYVAVDDVDERAARVEALGGKLCMPPTDIPNVGRFCVITDPSGASLALITMKGASS
jgi:uncharacterized protein